MAKKKKGKKKISLRVLIPRLCKKADRALSEYARALTAKEYGGKCPLCGRGPLIPNKPSKRDKRTEVPAIQCCFHFIRRKRKVLRWDLRNVVGACHRCNYVEYRDPDLSRAWFVRNRGVDLYLELVDKSVESFDPTVEFLEGIVSKYEALLSELRAPQTSTLAPQTSTLASQTK